MEEALKIRMVYYLHMIMNEPLHRQLPTLIEKELTNLVTYRMVRSLKSQVKQLKGVMSLIYIILDNNFPTLF